MAIKNKKLKEKLQDERLQAIVLTDSFQTRFMPLTSEHPRCLLPLGNVPLIEYTMQFLATAGVSEVYLMCSSHAEKVQSYIDNSKWKLSRVSPFTIHTIISPEFRSVGDAMRDLDNRGLITGDFLLISGDVVTNIDFKKVMDAHKKIKLMDKDHILTMVLTHAGASHRTRSPVDPAVFALDRKTNRCIYYQAIPPIDGKKTEITMDSEILDNVEDEMVICNDLIDCHIDICTPHVPQIFQENFDYQDLRSDFLRGVLTSDLLKKTIYAYVTDGIEYAARVESWATYEAVSQDILARWTYPLAPDSNLLGNTSYKYEFNHVYKEDNIVLARSCKIGSCSCIGRNTFVDEGTSIKHSVIGRNCRIGKNVSIQNAHIWDGAVIGDNTNLCYCIVASEAQVGNNVRLEPGVVLSYGVRVDDAKKVPENIRICASPIRKDNEALKEGFHSDEEESGGDRQVEKSDGEEETKDPEVVGDNGVGIVYVSDDEIVDESDSESSNNPHYLGLYSQIKSLNVSDDSIASVTEKKLRKSHRRRSRTRRFSSTSAVSTDREVGAFSEEEEEEDFQDEAIATVHRAMENGYDLDTALLELNTLRMSLNVSYHDVRFATTKALLSKIADFIATDTLPVKEATEKVFNKWGLLYKRQMFDDEEQVDLLMILQNLALSLEPDLAEKVLFIAINSLYDRDVIEEDNIYKWWDSDDSVASEPLIKVRTLVGKWVSWLKEAEEESDEEDEE